MNSNLSRIVLLIGVCILWGLIGYRIYQYDYPKPDVLVPKKTIVLPKNTSVVEKTLVLDYRDPFLGSVKKNPVSDRQSAQRASAFTSPKSKASVRWPNIQYQGYVAGNESLILINVNGQSKLVSVGDQIDSFRIESFSAEQVLISCNRETRTFNKY